MADSAHEAAACLPPLVPVAAVTLQSLLFPAHKKRHEQSWSAHAPAHAKFFKTGAQCRNETHLRSHAVINQKEALQNARIRAACKRCKQGTVHVYVAIKMHTGLVHQFNSFVDETHLLTSVYVCVYVRVHVCVHV